MCGPEEKEAEAEAQSDPSILREIHGNHQKVLAGPRGKRCFYVDTAPKFVV